MSETLTLRPAQAKVKSFIKDVPYCGIFADMGFGKGATTLSAIVELVQDLDVSKILVVSTKRVAEKVWLGEVTRWAQFNHLSLRVLKASDFNFKRKDGKNVPQSSPDAFLDDCDIHTIHADLLAPLASILKAKSWKYDMVVLDESALFRTPGSKRFKAMKAVRKSARMGRLVLLTGTPAPKNIENIWAQIYLLDQGQRLGGSMTAFRERFMEPDKRNAHQIFSWKPKPGAEEEIYRLISDICISVMPEDLGVELPAREFCQIPVTLPGKALAKYRDMERHFLIESDKGDIVAANAAVHVFKLLQMASGAVFDENQNVQHIHDAKIEAMHDLVEAMQGKPLLVAYWYSHERDRIKRAFPNAVCLEEDDQAEARWNQGEIEMLLIHPSSGAHGLNLQFNAGHTVWFSPIHDLEKYLQLNRRLHRPGRKYPVQIYHLIAEGTIDRAVLESLDPKNKGQNLLLEALRIRRGELNAV